MTIPKEARTRLSIPFPQEWLTALEAEAATRQTTVEDLVRKTLNDAFELSPRQLVEDPLGWVFDKVLGH